MARNWAIEWIGSLPGKRENRRYTGAHTLTQNDVREGGQFDDIVAYGGWPMDDHHPAGIFYPGEPTIFHPSPSPFGIPYRSLYSRNIDNLLFAGRNISVTHAALSSTRVMGTCAILGQAVGTAAALCTRHRCAPQSLGSGERLHELQTILMDDDCWLPGLSRQLSPLVQEAQLIAAGPAGPLLHDGVERDRANESHAWVGPADSTVEYRWKQPVEIGGARLAFDSNLANVKRMPCSYPQQGDRTIVPSSLVRQFRLEAQNETGQWVCVHEATNNYQRLVSVPLQVRTTALRLTPQSTWGAADVRLFAFEPLRDYEHKFPVAQDGPKFSDVRATLSAADLAPPENSGEDTVKSGRGA